MNKSKVYPLVILGTVAFFCFFCANQHRSRLSSRGVRNERKIAHRTPSNKKRKLMAVIRSYMGTPYHYGGSSKKGIDCSGLVMRVFKKVYGIKLPHSAEGTFKMGKKIRPSQLTPGDVVYFSIKGRGINHNGIYTGNGEFAHASSSQGVIISRLADPYYKKRYRGARRLF